MKQAAIRWPRRTDLLSTCLHLVYERGEPSLSYHKRTPLHVGVNQPTTMEPVVRDSAVDELAPLMLFPRSKADQVMEEFHKRFP